jgi:hypothetical protein
LPSPNVNTHLPDFVASAAGLLATGFLAALSAGLAGLLFSALRVLAGGAALARTGMDGFDFAAIFLAFATALAMTENYPLKGKDARLTPRLGGPAQAASSRFERYI